MKPRAFVSGVTSELSSARKEVARKLRSMGFDVDTQEDWQTRGGYLLHVLRDMVSTADVFIQIVGRFPGAVADPADPEFPGNSFTQLEFRYAQQANKATGKPEIYLFPVSAEVSNDDNEKPTPEQSANQAGYREEIRRIGLLQHGVATTDRLLDKITDLEFLHGLIRKWFDAWKSQGGPPIARPADVSDGLHGFSLATLHYSNRWLPWQQRPQDEEALKNFLADERPFLWWVITGEGGVGKSRLAQEVMLGKENDSWAFGTLSPNDRWWDDNGPWVPDGKVLIVSDYAASRRNWTDALFKVASRTQQAFSKGNARVRVLLLTRPDGFTSFLKGNANDERFRAVKKARYADASGASQSSKTAEAAGDERLILRRDALELKPVDSSLRDALLRVLESIGGKDAEALDRLKQDVPDENQRAYWKSLQMKTGGGRWLLIQIYGWLFSLKQAEADKGGRKTDFEVAENLDTLLKAFLVREIRSNWTTHHGRARSADDEDTDRIMSVLATTTIQQGLSRVVFEKLPEVRKLTAKRRGILWRRCQAILGGDQNGDRLPPVEPDLAGEALVVQALSTLGWDADAPGDGHFVPSFDKEKVLVRPRRVVRRGLRHNRDGLAHFLGLIGRDFVEHDVTFKLFDISCQLVLFSRTFVPTDNLLAALFDYGWGDYENESSRPKKYALSLLRLLEERTELQQYIYDSGLIPRYAKFLERKADEVRSTGDQAADVLSGALVLKLLGHELYRKNSVRGPELFDEALALVEKAKGSSDKALDGRAWLLPWYRVFFNDHHSNDLSKNKAFPEIERFTAYETHRQSAFEALPERLRSATEMPHQAELPLLIRSAHFWGHVGNQEGRLLASYRNPKKNGAGPPQPRKEEIQKHLEQGQQAYLRAALFRMAGYKTSFLAKMKRDSIASQAFDRAVEAVLQLSSEEGQWLNDFLRTEFKDGPREHFMHPSQSLGDTAHQLIGAAKLYYEAVAVLWTELSLAEREALHTQGQLFLRAGKALWSSAEAVAHEEGSKLIQYYIWTVEDDLLSMMTAAALQGGAAAVRKLPVLEELGVRLKSVLETHHISYPDAEQKIRKTIEEFLEYLLRVLDGPRGQKN